MAAYINSYFLYSAAYLLFIFPTDASGQVGLGVGSWPSN